MSFIPTDKNPDDNTHYLNTNTYVSLSIVVLFILGFLWINKGLNDNARATADLRADLTLSAATTNSKIQQDIQEIKTQISDLKSGKNLWGYGDMLRWSIHLQQLNKDPKKLQSEGLAVPEPETPTK